MPSFSIKTYETESRSTLLETTLRPGKRWCKEVNKGETGAYKLESLISILPATCFTSHFCVISTELDVGFMAVFSSFQKKVEKVKNRWIGVKWLSKSFSGETCRMSSRLGSCYSRYNKTHPDTSIPWLEPKERVQQRSGTKPPDKVTRGLNFFNRSSLGICLCVGDGIRRVTKWHNYLVYTKTNKTKRLNHADQSFGTCKNFVT